MQIIGGGKYKKEGLYIYKGGSNLNEFIIFLLSSELIVFSSDPLKSSKLYKDGVVG